MPRRHVAALTAETNCFTADIGTIRALHRLCACDFDQYAHGKNAMNLPPLNSILEALAEGVRRFGPYLLTELLLPGGTVLAVLLFLARRRRARLARAAGRSVHRPRCTRDVVTVAAHTARVA